jgi:hypothetical protein
MQKERNLSQNNIAPRRINYRMPVRAKEKTNQPSGICLLMRQQICLNKMQNQLRTSVGSGKLSSPGLKGAGKGIGDRA